MIPDDIDMDGNIIRPKFFPSGRKEDIIFEDYVMPDPETGMSIPVDDVVVVYADPNMADIIRDTEGIRELLDWSGCRYVIAIDPRYKIDWVREEIKAQILINQEI